MTTKTKHQTILRLTDSDAALVSDWRDLDATIKKLTVDRDSIQGGFLQALQSVGAELAHLNGMTLVRLVPGGRDQIATKRLKVERPDIASAFTEHITWENAKYTDA